MLIGAIIAAIAAIVLFIIARSQSSKAGELAATETSTAAALTELAGKITTEIGAGSFSQTAELKGRAAAEPPLTAEFSSTPCVWYECVATREYEEEYWETDKDGHRQRRTRRGTEQMSHILRENPFWIEDATGKISIDPRGAAIDAEKSFSRFEPGEGSGVLKIGSFSLALGAILGGARKTLGYRFEEKSIPIGRQLYVLGEATDSAGSLTIRKPTEKGKRYIISIKSEEEIVAGAKGAAKWLSVGAIVAAVAAAALAVLGIFAG